MKIVHVTSAHPWYATRIFSKMCVHLANNGHDVDIVAIDVEANELRVFEKSGVNIHLVAGNGNKSRLNRSTLMSWRIFRYAKRLKADLIQFHDPEMIPTALLISGRKTPLIFDAHVDFIAEMDLAMDKRAISQDSQVGVESFFNF